MSDPKPGDRVGVMCGSDGKTVEFFGFGVYVGDEVPPATAGGFNFGRKNPKLQLDNGKVVWGCESWWGLEAEMKERLAYYVAKGMTIVDVDIDAIRAKYAVTETPKS